MRIITSLNFLGGFMAITNTTEQNSFIVTPVLSDNIKDAWNKLVSDFQKSGVLDATIADLRNGANKATADLLANMQSAGYDVVKTIHNQFVAFEESSSAGMDSTAKAVYLKLMGNADATITALANQAVADVWKESSDLNVAINAILDNALQQKVSPDINVVANQVFGAIQKEFGDLFTDFKNDIFANCQKALVDIPLAAGAAGLMVSKDQFTQLGNNIVTAVGATLLVDSAKAGKDLTVDFFATAADLTETINKNRDSLIKIAIIDGANLVQTAVKAAAKTLKKWFKW